MESDRQEREETPTNVEGRENRSESEGGTLSAQPGFTLNLDSHTRIKAIPTLLYVLARTPITGYGSRHLIEARSPLPNEGEGAFENGVYLDTCSSYAVRAVRRLCSRWYVPVEGKSILAILPKSSMLALYDQLLHEYRHRFCSQHLLQENRTPDSSSDALRQRRRERRMHRYGVWKYRGLQYIGSLCVMGSAFALRVHDVRCCEDTLYEMHCPTCENLPMPAWYRGRDSHTFTWFGNS